MTKSQFNVKISKDLLTSVKRQAMMSGKSLTEHITDLLTDSLANINSQENNIISVDTIKNIEERLLLLESKVSNHEYLSQKLEPFTNQEAINCTNFMRGVFDQEIVKRNYNKNNAFDDFLKHLKVYIPDNETLNDRLKEIMLTDEPKPWTAEELNDLTNQNKCNCPIRKALINWTGKTYCPSQQEICDKGDQLLSLSFD